MSAVRRMGAAEARAKAGVALPLPPRRPAAPPEPADARLRRALALAEELSGPGQRAHSILAAARSLAAAKGGDG